LRKQGAVLIHSCLAGEYDPFDVSRCKCKQLATKDEVVDLFKQYLIRNLAADTRHADFWDGRSDVFLLNSHKQTPRVATLEQSHIERGLSRVWDHRGKSQFQLEAEHQDLERRIAEDKLEKVEEERLRWDVWDQLQNQWLASITVEVPEAEWIAAEKSSRGDLACRTILSIDERTSAGADYNRPSTRESIEERDEDRVTPHTENRADSRLVAIDGDLNPGSETEFQSYEDLTDIESEHAEAA